VLHYVRRQRWIRNERARLDKLDKSLDAGVKPSFNANSKALLSDGGKVMSTASAASKRYLNPKP